MNAIAALVLAAIRNTVAAKGAGWLHRTAGSVMVKPRLASGAETLTYLEILLEMEGEALVEVTSEARAKGAAFGACRYFRMELAVLDAGLEAVALISEMSDDDLAAIRVVRGRHGVELVGPTIQPRPTHLLHFIVGHPTDPQQEPGEDAVLYTWYPGRLTQPLRINDAVVKLSG